MLDRNLHTWRGIKAFLDRLDGDGREPDPWEVHFVIAAITNLTYGDGHPELLDAAELPATRRVASHQQEITSKVDYHFTKSDLRAAFLALPVPGGHPS